VNKKPKRRLPYVGDDAGLSASALRENPTQFKSVETPTCCVCDSPYAPFGMGFPDATQWFCRKHVIAGGHMPEVQNDIERAKMNEARRRTVRAAKLWLDLYTACANGEPEVAKSIWPHIRDVSVEVSDILKTLGKP
jgi:hypothetical protein